MTILAFAIIYFVWGSTFLAIRFGGSEVPPYCTCTGVPASCAAALTGRAAPASAEIMLETATYLGEDPPRSRNERA